MRRALPPRSFAALAGGALLAASSLVAPAGCDRALGLPDWSDPDSNLVCDGGTCECTNSMASCDGTLDNGCEVNLDNDRDNCGRCFHSCGGGDCRSGLCTPVQIADFASSGGELGGILDDYSFVAASGYLYYAVDEYIGDQDHLYAIKYWRLPAAASLQPWTPELIAAPAGGDGLFMLDRRGAGAPRGLILSGYSEVSNAFTVLSIGLDGAAGQKTIAAGPRRVGALALAKECLYLSFPSWLTSDSGALYVDLSEPSPAPGKPLAEFPSGFYKTAGDGETAYLIEYNGSTVYASGPVCGQLEAIPVYTGGITAMTVDPSDGTLYLAGAGSEGYHILYRRARGGQVEELGPLFKGLFGNDPQEAALQADALVADHGEVYWLTTLGHAIGRITLTGADTTSQVLASGRTLGTQAFLAVDEDRVYWVESSTIYGMARP
jgi:hypothetical protein